MKTNFVSDAPIQVFWDNLVFDNVDPKTNIRGSDKSTNISFLSSNHVQSGSTVCNCTVNMSRDDTDPSHWYIPVLAAGQVGADGLIQLICNSQEVCSS